MATSRRGQRAGREDEPGGGGEAVAGEAGGGTTPVLVELRVQHGTPPNIAMGMASQIDTAGFRVDESFEAVPMGSPAAAADLGAAPPETVVVRGMVAEGDIPALEARPEVVRVWRDTPVAPFPAGDGGRPGPGVDVRPDTGPCPAPPCDCDPGRARGTIADAARFLGVSRIWAAGFRGNGIVVGVVDGGITAHGRPVVAGERPRVPRVVGGFPVGDWGTTPAPWGEHGNMCATDVLGMAPQARLYDIRIASGTLAGTISTALAGYQWAIDRHRLDGTPHVLTNSWGIYQEAWDNVYAHDPNHPFTRKVVEALDEGILVAFAAGNCGSNCPDSRCGDDNGPGRGIWGANSHPRVMTVGAVNRDGELVGYSSQGPGALDANKPDFCSVTHFAGYFPNLNPSRATDSGTSAATPVLAGVVALLKQALPSATQARIKAAIRATCRDLGPPGFDQHTGAGVVRARAALDRLRRRPIGAVPRPGGRPVTVARQPRYEGRPLDLPAAGAAGWGARRPGRRPWPVSPLGLGTSPHDDVDTEAGTEDAAGSPGATLAEYDAAIEALQETIRQASEDLAALEEEYAALRAELDAGDQGDGPEGA